MSKSQENNNGRYFEYLITKHLIDKYRIALTDRAERDQNRDKDKEKEIKVKVKDRMMRSLDKISSWLNKKITLDDHATLDRLPDNNPDGSSHEDINIRNSMGEEISFSLKHNSHSIYHGRPWTICNWIGIEEDHKVYRDFNQNILNTNDDLLKKIPKNTIFADGGVKEEFKDIWSNYVERIYENMKNVLIFANTDNEYILNIFKRIVGGGKNQFRIILDGKSIYIQNLNNLKPPDKLSVSIINKNGNHVRYICICFNNGLKIEARSKHDKRCMTKIPPLKPDWKVVDWGQSGVIVEKIKI